MTVKISKALVSKLEPADVRPNVEQILWDKSGGVCYLCDQPLNRAADDIEADHDIPEVDDGPTTLENLNLAHVSCNRAKRSAKTVPIKPYLKLIAYTKNHGGRLKYDGYLKHFGIDPRPVVYTRQTDRANQAEQARFELPDTAIRTVPIFSEQNKAGVFDYVYLSLPREAIFNDDSCQPRTLRTEHAWSIFGDLQKNVLHEPPSCRLEAAEENTPVRLLMFDGQHKTVANWMMGRSHVTTKVYLNLSTAQAIQLVNSIQAKIKKLPLSPFELAGKMADEWENKFNDYEAEVGSTEVSEVGFLAWLGADKTRGRQALQSALVESVLSNPNLRIASHVKRPGAPSPQVAITEQALKGKVIEKLLYLDALKDKGENAQASRDAEAENIVRALNLLNDAAFEPSEEAQELTPTQLERARRMTYQSSLAYIAALIRALWGHLAFKTGTKWPMSDDLPEQQEKQLGDAIQRIVDHPAWTADFDRDEKMKRLKVALEKNQEVPKALEDLGLDLAYLLLGDQAAAYKNHWIN